MTKDINSLVNDIYDLFKGKTLTEHLDTFTSDMSSIMTSRFGRYSTDKREPKLVLSMVGKPLRQIFYELKGYKGEELQPSTLFKFLYGDLLESLLIYLAKESGHSIELLQERFELDGVPGKIDCVIDGYLIDIKSCSERAFKKFTSRSIKTDDPFGYMQQIAAYSLCLTEKDYLLKGAGFLAVDKQHGSLCLCLFTLEELKDLNPKGRIHEIKECLSNNKLPLRCYPPKLLDKKQPDGPTILGTGCAYCGFKEECYKDINGGKGLTKVEYLTGPKWFIDTKGRKFKVDNWYTNEDEFPMRED